MKKCGNFAQKNAAKTAAKRGKIAENCEQIAQNMHENCAYVVKIYKRTYLRIFA